MTDNSFKLFAADPTPGHDPKRLILPYAKSTSALNETPARDTETEDVNQSRAKKLDHGDSGVPAYTPTSHIPTSPTQGDSHAQEKPKEIIRGPWRILRLLPRETRHVIGRMLEIDPRKRARMEEVLQDSWVADTIICRQTEPGVVVNTDDHIHTLESSNT
jgi:hypothetical protein